MTLTALTDTDISFLRFIQQHRLVELDPLLYYISYFTTFVSIGIVLTILIVSLKNKSKALRLVFFKMLAVLIIAASISLSLKTLIFRERPFKVYPDIEKLSEGGSSSFPSGHTLETFAIAVGLSVLVPKKRIIMPVFLWALLVAYSRMALGVHYPGDVLAGMLIGSLIGFLVPLLFKIIKKQN